MSLVSKCLWPCFGQSGAQHHHYGSPKPVTNDINIKPDHHHQAWDFAPESSTTERTKPEKPCGFSGSALRTLRCFQDVGLLRSKLIRIRGSPLCRIAEGTNLVTEMSGAGLTSILGAGDTGLSTTDVNRWTALHSAGIAAAVLYAGLQLPAINASAWADEFGWCSRPLELPLAGPEVHQSKLQAGLPPDPLTATPASPMQSSLPLPPEWRHTLQELSAVCPAPQWRAVLLPLMLDGRLVGAMLMLLPNQQQLQQQTKPPEGTLGSSGSSSEPSQQVVVEAGSKAAGVRGSSAGCGPDAMFDSLLVELAECVAECCLGPILPHVEQLCLAAEALSSAVSLQDLAAALTGSVSALLSSELHLELAVKLALLPNRDCKTGVLFNARTAAVATDRTASRSGFSQPSPRCVPQGLINTTATGLSAGSGTPTAYVGSNAMGGSGAAYNSQQSGSLAMGTFRPPGPPSQSQMVVAPLPPQLTQQQQQSLHRQGPVGGGDSYERMVGRVLQQSLGRSSGSMVAVAGGCVARGVQGHGKRILVTPPSGGRDGIDGPEAQVGEATCTTLDSEPTALTPCTSTTANSALALCWAPIMVSNGLGQGDHGAVSGPPGGGVSGNASRNPLASQPHLSSAQACVSRSHLSTGGPTNKLNMAGLGSGPSSNRAGGWKASPFDTSSTLLVAMLNGKMNHTCTGALPAMMTVRGGNTGGVHIGMGGISVAAMGGSTAAAATSGSLSVHLRSVLVPDVPSWLQDAAQPTGDVFSIVRRAGVAGSLASLIAMVAEPVVEAPVDVAAAGGAAAAMLAISSLPRHRPTTGLLTSGPVTVRDYGVNSAGAARVGESPLPLRSICLGPRQARNWETIVDGYDSVGGTPGHVATVGGGDNVGGMPCSWSVGSAVVGLYLYSFLPLPQSFLQAAREQAVGLLQVLAPVVMRSLHIGHVADEWTYLCNQVLGGGGGGANVATVAGLSCSTSPVLMPTQSIGLEPVTPAMAVTMAMSASATTAASVEGPLHVSNGVATVATRLLGATSGTLTTADPSVPPPISHLEFAQMPFVPPSRHTAADRNTAAATPLVIPISSMSPPTIPPNEGTSSACQVSSSSGARLPVQLNTVCHPLECTKDPCITALYSTDDTEHSNGDIDGRIRSNFADMEAMGMGVGGSGVGGGMCTPGAFHTGGSHCMDLLTTTMSDLGPVAHQQKMEMLVTAFTTTLSRARMDMEHQGGAHAENDIRNLRVLRAIGVGGCSVVVMARLHAMPVAVKVILPLDDENDDAATATANGSDLPSEAVPPVGQQSYKGLMPGTWATDGGVAQASKGTRAARMGTGQRQSRLQALMRNARELAVLTTISHPNIVQVYSYCTRVIIREEPGEIRLEVAPVGGTLSAPLCTALIMEYCDMGSLADYIDSGSFARAARTAAATMMRQQRQQLQLRAAGDSGSSSRRSNLSSSAPVPTGAGSPAIAAMYLTLVEVALALRHIHAMNLVHCDVKPANVLLRSSATDPRGFTAKLTDFGFVNLAMRNEGLEGPGASEHEPVGTMTHMAPELLQGYPLAPSVDVYSFGILMWEIYTGRAPYSAYADNFAMVPQKVLKEGLRPKFPPDTPTRFKNLAVCCWSSDVAQRPSASELVTSLQALLDASCGSQGL